MGRLKVMARHPSFRSRPFSTHRLAANEGWLLNQAMATVKQYDSATFLPGYILSDQTMRLSYFALRAFWIETGLRFGSTSFVSPNSTPVQHVQWWSDGIHRTLFSISSSLVEAEPFQNHPILQLLLLLKEKYHVRWNQSYFEAVLNGRLKDLDVQQYTTVNDLIQYANQSCGSLAKLLLESGQLYESTNPQAHAAAELAGIGHGLSNALRQSVAILSTAGKLIVPADLTLKYNVRSPRYLLSALSSGDEACEYALQQCVREIVELANDHIERGRALSSDVLSEPNGRIATSCLLSTIPAELFLRRLERFQYKLTDRNLRSSSIIEQLQCATQIITAFLQSKY
jgi:phytoene/squalene synthetase